MGKYKRLKSYKGKKSNALKKVGGKMAKTVKWTSILSLMTVLVGGAVVSFYMFVDSDVKDNILVKSSEFVDSISRNSSALGYEDDDKKLEGEISESGSIESDSLKSDGQENAIDKSGSGEEKNYDFSKWNSSCDKEMIVVNKNNPLPKDLKIKTKVCRGKEVGIDVYENLEKMISDAKNDGILLWISSGYRSIELQTKLFNRQVEREKNKGANAEEAEKRAQKVVAKPHTSEHNTGLAIDFNGVEDNFYQTKEYDWLIQHAADYGFIERYQRKDEAITGVIYEPWHFRYVGIENAQKIKESGLCLEEYVHSTLMK